MSAFVTAGAGFLLAVLWFDLMFDVQSLRHRGTPALPADVLASISAYYRRVTTTATPMNRLVGAVMLGTLAALVIQLTASDDPAWVAAASLPLTLAPVGLATGRTFPRAVRQGRAADDAAVQTALARATCRDHLFCATAIASVLALQLGFAG